MNSARFIWVLYSVVPTRSPCIVHAKNLPFNAIPAWVALANHERVFGLANWKTSKSAHGGAGNSNEDQGGRTNGYLRPERTARDHIPCILPQYSE